MAGMSRRSEEMSPTIIYNRHIFIQTRLAECSQPNSADVCGRWQSLKGKDGDDNFARLPFGAYASHSVEGEQLMAELAWWRHGVFYQIYPRSFQDGNGDGVGDLAGIARRLPYLRQLGVDALWLSPFYPSPMADFGYDIADYCAVDPLFGTLADFDALLVAAHRLGLKLVVDLVPNHTSDQHPWFAESKAGRSSAKRDWYIWRDAKPNGSPPNNWQSHFGGSAWEWDEASRQYYYHAYHRTQPDLNWRNPAVRQAIHQVMRFWLKRGVDGFRVDVLWHLMKDEAFRDNPPNPDYRPGRPAIERLSERYSADQPDVHEVVRGLRAVVDEFPDRVLIGETYLPIDRLVTYYGNNDEAHLPFNFHLIDTPWTAEAVGRLIEIYEAALPPGAWPNWVMGNHDRPRMMGRLGEDGARLAAMLILTLRGTPTLYYGDEIGLPQTPIAAGDIKDPWGKSEPAMGRDPCRTPMAWDDNPQAGFSAVSPWLPLHEDWRRRNVARLCDDPASLLTLYRRLIELRRAHRALTRGGYRQVLRLNDVLGFAREDGAHASALYIFLNFSPEARLVDLPGEGPYRLLLSTFLDRGAEEVSSKLLLRRDEGVILAPG